ncbi:MAG: M20 family metallo-hydrolase [Bacteroidia bacterium]|nr:M20 family metallo-hydrolase [Bacteroidia bacterium]
MTVDSARIAQLQEAAYGLLRELIAIPSFSREESGTASRIEAFFRDAGVDTRRTGNNVWARSRHFREGLPVVLLNSHHDTVRPHAAWTYDPFTPAESDGRLYGLGSNDAGGALTALMAVFLYFHDRPGLPFNLLFAASAEEEISGVQGIEAILPELGPIDLGIVGEPTQMHLAIAEKGLLVLDCTARGRAGHAAREEGLNAIYEALADIEWFRTYQFAQVSDFLGPVKMTVTQIQAGSQHNVVPDSCAFVVDVRTNECYSNREAYDLICAHVRSEVRARSFRLNSSRLPEAHPVVQRGLALGRRIYGSPTTSDQALMPFPTLKIGPGDSARSHTADEYLLRSELEEGIDLYIRLLEGLDLQAWRFSA